MQLSEQVAFDLRALYSRYGYSQYKMSKFEEYDLYARNKDFLISENVITFTDLSGKLMALKPDVTLSIVKNTTDQVPWVQKLYYNENVYRTAKGAAGYREIMQTGLEVLHRRGSGAGLQESDGHIRYRRFGHFPFGSAAAGDGVRRHRQRASSRCRPNDR